MPTARPAESLRQRQRDRVRKEVTDAGLELFLTRGFDTTTVDDVAVAAGVSRTTFFRYFATKEELVLADMERLCDTFVAALTAQPAGVPPQQALDAAAVALPEAALSPEQALAVWRLVDRTPSLRARRLEKQRHWTERLVPLVEQRLDQRQPAGRRHLHARAKVEGTLACLTIATDCWGRSGGTADLTALYHEAAAAMRA